MEMQMPSSSRAAAAAPAWDAGDDSDFGLVVRARAGDTEAFNRLMQRHHDRLTRFCARYLDCEADIEDVCQTVLLKVYRNLGRFEPRHQFVTWLYRIAANASIDLIRQHNRRMSIMVSSNVPPNADGEEPREREFAALTEGPDGELERAELAVAIRAALHALPAKQREAICHREFDGLRYEEIAELAGISVGAVKSRIFNARRKLMKSLAGWCTP